MKSWSIALAAVFLLFFSSSQITEPTEAKIGEYAPIFSISNNVEKFDLREMRGKYVLLSFWSSDDAQARIDNAQYAITMRDINDSNIKYISINTDSDKKLWKQIIEIDNLNTVSQYSSQETVKGNIIEDYHLETGNRAYLINPDGKIEAVNPSVNQLVKLN